MKRKRGTADKLSREDKMCESLKQQTSQPQTQVKVGSFKIGDKVQVRPGYTNNAKYKGVGTIIGFEKNDLYPDSDFVYIQHASGEKGGWYHQNVVLVEPKPLSQQKIGDFQVGERVQTRPGYVEEPITGKVVRTDAWYVYVENEVNGVVGGWYPKNLVRLGGQTQLSQQKFVIEYTVNGKSYQRSGNLATKDVFTNKAEAEQAAAREQASMGYGYTYRAVPYDDVTPTVTAPKTVPTAPPVVVVGTVLAQAKAIAKELGKQNGIVTIDAVQARLATMGLDKLGNAAGSVFRGKEWQATGQFVATEREKGHARKIGVWKYVGA